MLSVVYHKALVSLCQPWGPCHSESLNRYSPACPGSPHLSCSPWRGLPRASRGLHSLAWPSYSGCEQARLAVFLSQVDCSSHMQQNDPDTYKSEGKNRRTLGSMVSIKNIKQDLLLKYPQAFCPQGPLHLLSNDPGQTLSRSRLWFQSWIPIENPT
jgi:hypothetical protein